MQMTKSLVFGFVNSSDLLIMELPFAGGYWIGVTPIILEAMVPKKNEHTRYQ